MDAFIAQVILVLIAMLLLGALRILSIRRRGSLRTSHKLFLAAAEQALKLEETDPAAARRIMDQAAAGAATVEDRERAELRQKAPFDRGAAVELRKRLVEDLRVHAAARRDLQRESPTDPGVALGLRSIDDAEKATRQQLAEVETHLQRPTQT